MKNNKEEVVRGKIILATVEGDIHDIGKNIVKVILESYGFKVIDLGKNVPAEASIKSGKGARNNFSWVKCFNDYHSKEYGKDNNAY